jgi:hypothetical protein
LPKTIWKFPLTGYSTDNRKDIPKGFKVLHFGEQHGHACFWAEIEPEAATETVEFSYYGTGWELPDDPGEYLGTFVVHNSLVWHWYMKRGV